VAVEIAALAAAHPGIAFGDARVVDTGWDFEVVDTGEWVFRVPRRPAVAAALEVERRLLALLVTRVPVPVPDMSLHRLADGTPYGLYPRLPGSPAGCEDAGPVAGGVAAFLTALHAVDPLDALLLGLTSPEKLDLDLLASRAAAEVVPLLPWESVAALRDAFAVLRDPVAVETVVHADLGEANLLVSEGALAAVIDWTDAHVGDPAMDLAWFAQCLGPAGARAAFVAYVPPAGADAETLWRRAVAHATVQPVHAVLYGLDRGDPSYVSRQLARIVPGGGG
jgi:aminoglycoside phosphotransferase (APT) family kinase protein